MIYANIFNLTGTVTQQSIVQGALDQIKFPWERLQLPHPPTEIGWDNLNDGRFSKALKHEAKKPEPLAGKVNGRKYILGIFYPGSGEIYIDNLLVDYPEIAKATVSAEIAHSVDEFLPLTDIQREQIMDLCHPGEPLDTWWEKIDYGTEYYSLVGEGFMQMFTVAYSDMPFGNAMDFEHTITYEQAPALRAIIGIERTDLLQVEVFGKSKVFHGKDKHYPYKQGQIITDTKGLTPCKYCLKKGFIK